MYVPMYLIVPDCLCIECHDHSKVAIAENSIGDLFYFICRRCHHRIYVKVELDRLEKTAALPDDCAVAQPWGKFDPHEPKRYESPARQPPD
jgi:DNA-directed RNA polymerase subunit RPC12/RpoP